MKTDSKSYPRLVSKDGRCLVRKVDVPKTKRKQIKSLFHYLIDWHWRWIFLIFAGGFVGSWLLFAVIYYVIGLIRGDYAHFEYEGWTPCISNQKDFVSALLFSLETQQTIGYGTRAITIKCPEAVLFLCLQSICGALLMSFLGGMFVAKLLRPKHRGQQVIFSKTAVICEEEGGEVCFMYRVGDLKDDANIVESHFRLYLVKYGGSKQGPNGLKLLDMNVGYDAGFDRVLLMWPITVRHVIDEHSPLHGVSERKLWEGSFEIIAVVEGIVESTGMTVQARTSYLPQEILWGHRFHEITSQSEDGRSFEIQYKEFHRTYSVGKHPDWCNPAFESREDVTCINSRKNKAKSTTIDPIKSGIVDEIKMEPIQNSIST